MRIANFLIALAAGLGATSASAQQWPTKAVRIIVNVAPGGVADVTARVLGARLTETLGQPFVVENRPGAGGLVALEAAAKSAPDGYTLVVGSGGPLTISPSLYKDRGFDPLAQLDPIIWFSNTKIVMVARSDLPANTPAEVIALSKASAGSLTMASAGSGSILHLVGEYFQGNAGVKWTHVPYKGSAPAAADLVARRVDLMFDALPTVLPYIKSGQIKFLASTTTSRSRQLPEGATFEELGFAGFADIGSWSSLMAPKGTPAEIVARLNEELNRALKSTEVQGRLAAMGADAEGGAPERVTRLLTSELARWGRIIQNAGLKPD